MSDVMTDEMIDIAKELHSLADKYRQLYKQENGNNHPVIWIENNSTGNAVIISDGFNAGIIKRAISSV